MLVVPPRIVLDYTLANWYSLPVQLIDFILPVKFATVNDAVIPENCGARYSSVHLLCEDVNKANEVIHQVDLLKQEQVWKVMT